MKRRLWLIVMVVALLTLALGGWAVDAGRWAVTGSRYRLRPA
jgi:hypothetical protein